MRYDCHAEPDHGDTKGTLAHAHPFKVSGVAPRGGAAQSASRRRPPSDGGGGLGVRSSFRVVASRAC